MKITFGWDPCSNMTEGYINGEFFGLFSSEEEAVAAAWRRRAAPLDKLCDHLFFKRPVT